MKLLVSTTSRFDSQLLVWAKQRRKLPEETPCLSQRMASLWLAEQYSILMQTAGSSVLWQLWEGAAQARCLPAQEQSSWWLLSPQHCDHSSPCHKGLGLGFHSCPLNHACPPSQRNGICPSVPRDWGRAGGVFLLTGSAFLVHTSHLSRKCVYESAHI